MWKKSWRLISNFCQKPWRPEGSGITYSKYWKKKERDLSSKNSISSKTIFQNWGEIKVFPDKQKLREFVTSWTAHKKY